MHNECYTCDKDPKMIQPKIQDFFHGKQLSQLKPPINDVICVTYHGWVSFCFPNLKIYSDMSILTTALSLRV